MGLNLPNDVPFKWIMSQTTKMFIPKVIMKNVDMLKTPFFQTPDLAYYS